MLDEKEREDEAEKGEEEAVDPNDVPAMQERIRKLERKLLKYKLKEKDQKEQEEVAEKEDSAAAPGGVAEVAEAQKKVQALEASTAELMDENRKLRMECDELKGKVRVVARCRPLTESERAVSTTHAIQFPTPFTVYSPERDLEFQYDLVVKPDDSQDEMWKACSQYCWSCVDGYNCCILAYGQTGAGKSYTLSGLEGEPGIAPRAIQEIFTLLKQQQEAAEYKVCDAACGFVGVCVRRLIGGLKCMSSCVWQSSVRRVHHGSAF